MRVAIDVRIYEDDHGWQALAESDMTIHAQYPVLFEQDWGHVVNPLIRNTLYAANSQLKVCETEPEDEEA